MTNLIASNHDTIREKVKNFNEEMRVGKLGENGGETSSDDDVVLVKGKSDIPLLKRQGFGQSILGTNDRRVEISRPESYPWRMICSLEMTSSSGNNYLGTGWIAGPSLVITAAHCIFDKSDGGWITSVKIFPGRSEETSPETFFTSTNFRAPKKWVDDENENFDYAAIILDEDIGSGLGYFSIACQSDDSLKNSMVNISGYPGSRAGEIQLHHANRILKVSSSKIYYDVDTEGGQSGSPIWVYEDNSQIPIVVGIHSSGTGKATLGNSGVRITSEVLHFIDALK
jgi:glutamyl endopeptidase